MNYRQSEQKLAPVHPFELYKPEWKISKQHVYTNDATVQHDFVLPDSVECRNTTTHHLILLQLSHGNRQINRIGDREYDGSFHPGNFFIHPATYSAFYSWETTDEAVSFAIKPTFLHRIAEETECLNSDKVELKPVLCDRDSDIEYIARSFLSEMQNEGIGGRLYSEALAMQLSIHLLRNYSAFPIKLKQYSDGLSPSKLQAAIDYIQANLEFKLKLKDLAKVTNTSSYHFCRLFKRSTGMTPFQYVLQQRIELGKRFLRQENLPISQISLMCGFASQSSFNTAFKKLVGVTPRQYRQQF